MDIYAKEGSKVTFANPTYGWDFDQMYAKEHLTLGETYTVKELDVGDWQSSVELEELPGKWFNTVLFEDSND